MPIALLIFVVAPLIELWVLVEVGRQIGSLPTVGLVVLTAVVGVSLLRQQGFSTLQRLNQRLAQGELPAQEMIDGIVLAVGGALLLTPGFLTDALGFICLIPGLRRWLLVRLLQHWQRRMIISHQVVWRQQGNSGPARHDSPGRHGSRERDDSPEGDKTPAGNANKHTIDGEYHRDD